MAFFQTISEDRFQANADFVVKESKTMRRIIGGFFLLFSLFMLREALWMGLIVGSIGIGVLIASVRNETVMTINRHGFFYYGKLFTSYPTVRSVLLPFFLQPLIQKILSMLALSATKAYQFTPYSQQKRTYLPYALQSRDCCS